LNKKTGLSKHRNRLHKKGQSEIINLRLELKKPT